MSHIYYQPHDTDNKVRVRVNYQDNDAADKIAEALFKLITDISPDVLTRVVLCVGSDRSTGDSLGPLVGTFLNRIELPRSIVWGTLSEPVHALNLTKYTKKISRVKSPLVIAVDASLGKAGNIGNIEVGAGPLYPGAGVNKTLPPVGDIHLSGIVNLGGFMEQMVLQSTRLHHVMEIAEVIARGIQKTLLRT